MIKAMKRMWGRTIGIDLGTVNTVVSFKGTIIAEEPTVVVYDDTGNTHYFGHDAQKMAGFKIQGLRVVWPMSDGKITDPDAIGLFLDYLIHKVCFHIIGINVQSVYRIAIAIPCQLPAVYKRQVVNSAKKYASDVVLVEQPPAAAFGEEDLDLDAISCVLMFDIGGGTTDTAVVNINGTVIGSSRSRAVGGNKMDLAIANHVLNNFGVKISLRQAQTIKHQIGCATIDTDEMTAFLRFKGYDKEGNEKSVRLTCYDMPKILAPTLEEIVDFGLSWFGEIGSTNPETLVRIQEGQTFEGTLEKQDSVVILTGGGGKLRNTHELLKRKMSINFRLAKNPLRAAALGAERIALDDELLKRFRIPEQQWGAIGDLDDAHKPASLPDNAPKDNELKVRDSKAALELVPPSARTA